ncbi:MAG: hypothetical protein FWG05_02105 [Kiritimatiellaeota bacterium]|nr:hypothetical protein [Kiritimatiellota bacterium]
MQNTRTNIIRGAALCAALTLSAVESSAQIIYSPKQDAYEFEGSAGGAQRLQYPVLKKSDGAEIARKNVAVEGTTARVEYADGTKVEITPNDNGLLYHFTSVNEAKGMVLKIDFNPNVIRKMLFAEGDGAPKAIPDKPPENGFLVSGDGKALKIVDAAGKGFVIGAPFGWVEFRDARVWGGNTALWWQTSSDIPMNGKEGWYNLALRDPAAPKIIVKSEEVKVEEVKKPSGDFQTSLTEWGVKIKIGEGGEYDFNFPKFQRDDLKDPRASKDGGKVTLTYSSGAKAVASLENNKLRIVWSGLPDGEVRATADMFIPFGFTQGGKWEIDGKKGEFPAEKAARGKIFQGDGLVFTLTHPTGMGFSIISAGGFKELQDNREWNWPIFCWIQHIGLWPNGGGASAEWSFAQSGAAKPNVLVDRFGQWVNADFPTKVKSEQELKDDFEADKKYYGSLNPPQRDPYGGLLGSKAKYNLKATGFFRLDKVNGVDVLVTPEGNVFFQLGVCGIMPIDEYTLIEGRESIYENIPWNDPAMRSGFRDGHRVFPSFHLFNYIRKTGNAFEPKSYFAEMIFRLRKWGFNSSGAWGGHVEGVNDEKKFPYVVEWLPNGGIAGVPGVGGIWDPFTPNAAKILDAEYAKHVAPRANDPLIIGWFFNNEPHIENLPKILPGLDSNSAAKKKFVEILKAKYGGISAFNLAWETNFITFDQLADAQLQARTRAAGEDAEAFFRLFLREYYGLINAAFRKHAPNHLLIGERLMPGTAGNQTLIEEQGRVLDIISVNYYTTGIDADYLRRLHKWSGGRPFILSEFYYSSDEQSLLGGNRVGSDRERGLAYRNYVEQAAALGFVVGIEWFLIADQATTGRFFQGFNGEAANTGFFNVADRPYKTMLENVMAANYGIYDVLLRAKKPFVFDDPRFTGKKGGAKKSTNAHRLTKPFVLDGIRSEWPGVPATILGKDGLVHGMDAEGFEATFTLAWDDENLYLFADVSDPTPMKNNHKSTDIWNADGIELFIGADLLEESGALKYCDRQIFLRAAPPFDKDSWGIGGGEAVKPIKLIAVPFTNGKGYSLEAAIPFENLGCKPKEGMTLLFDIAIDDSADGWSRLRQSVWNGDALNSKSRTSWGLLKLVP